MKKIATLVNANLDLEKLNDQETQSVRRQQGENKSTQRVTPCLKNYRETLHSFQTQSMENEPPFLEPLIPPIKSISIPIQDFNLIASLITKDEQIFRERIPDKRIGHQYRQSIG